MSVNSFNASNPPLTTKGDLYGFSTVPARVPVGTNGQVLTADSTATNGVAWATASAGGMTQIATGTLSGSEVSITSIPSTYVNLLLFINNPYIASGSAQLRLRINNYSGAQYGRWYMQSNGSNGGDGSSNTYWQIGDATNNPLRTVSTTSHPSAQITIFNYLSAAQKGMSYQIQDRANTFMSLGGTGGVQDNFDTNQPIDSVQILTSASTFSGGTYTLYGVK